MRNASNFVQTYLFLPLSGFLFCLRGRRNVPVGVGLFYPTRLKTHSIELPTSTCSHKCWLGDLHLTGTSCLDAAPKLGIPWVHRCHWNQPSSDRKKQSREHPRAEAPGVPRRGAAGSQFASWTQKGKLHADSSIVPGSSNCAAEMPRSVFPQNPQRMEQVDLLP